MITLKDLIFVLANNADVRISTVHPIFLVYDGRFGSATVDALRYFFEFEVLNIEFNASENKVLVRIKGVKNDHD